MGRPRSPVSRYVLVGGGALAAGLLVGTWWPVRNHTPLWTEPAAPPAPAVRVPGAPVASFADVVQRAGPAVVTVRAQLPVDPGSSEKGALTVTPPANDGSIASRPVYAPQPGFRTGSGFVVNARGLVVTSRHVVLGATAVDVLVPVHGTCRVTVVGEDPATDLALLRLEEPPDNLPVLAVGNSEDLRAGDWIVAVGNPFGFAQTVTAGVVSFVGRHLAHTDFGVTNDFLQISAPVNPGSSGCPVLNLAGEVVGVTTQAATAAQGISFAVPSRTLKWALDAMERQPDGRVRRGYLGIEFATRAGVDEQGAPCHGAVIVRVAEGEPAHRAGLRRGDVVLRVDGQPVPDAQVLHERIVRGDPGSRIALELLREGRVHDPIFAVLGEVGGPKLVGPTN